MVIIHDLLYNLHNMSAAAHGAQRVCTSTEKQQHFSTQPFCLFTSSVAEVASAADITDVHLFFAEVPHIEVVQQRV